MHDLTGAVESSSGILVCMRNGMSLCLKRHEFVASTSMSGLQLGLLTKLSNRLARAWNGARTMVSTADMLQSFLTTATPTQLKCVTPTASNVRHSWITDLHKHKEGVQSAQADSFTRHAGLGN